MSNEATAAPTGLRELTRMAVRQRIADAAIELFEEHGFDQVTVDQIAAAVGMSTRSFNRYFPNKEDVVHGDNVSWGAVLRDNLAARPEGEEPWEALRRAYAQLLGHGEADSDRQKRIMQVLNSTPALRAHNLEKHLVWAQLLTPVIAERLTGDDVTLRAEALVQASLACFDLTLIRWAADNETRRPVDLLDATFAALRHP